MIYPYARLVWNAEQILLYLSTSEARWVDLLIGLKLSADELNTTLQFMANRRPWYPICAHMRYRSVVYSLNGAKSPETPSDQVLVTT